MTREELLAALTHPMSGQQLRHAVLDDYDNLHGGEPVSDLAAANVFTSEMTDGSGMHKLVLDIDFPVKVIPSSTEGHFHLVIDKPVTKEGLFRILWALADEGIVEEGYASSSEARGYTALRVPWVRKDGAFRSVWTSPHTWRDPDCIECGGEGAPCCEPPLGPPPVDMAVAGDLLVRSATPGQSPPPGWTSNGTIWFKLATEATVVDPDTRVVGPGRES